MWLLSCLICLAGAAVAHGATNSVAFSRIIHGWTNYSTAFSATHDAQDSGEYATVATFYTPPLDVVPREFASIVIWYGTAGQQLDFAAFTFRVGIWSGLQAFTGNPKTGDVAHLLFEQASSISADAVTRGGRTAYELRFDLSLTNLTLTNCQTYLIGLIARVRRNQSGELFVPTAPFDGPSDVQAGNIVPFGWTYLINAGGATIYSGQLATQLTVTAVTAPPRLEIIRLKDGAQILWPQSATCFQLETAERLHAEWIPAPETNGTILPFPTTGPSRFFRLRQTTPEP